MSVNGFDRALEFFRYSRLAAWTALVASLLTAFLFVVLLAILGLFFDLVVNRGQVPALHQLAPTDVAAFLESVELPTDPAERTSRINEFVENVRALGLDDPKLEGLIAAEEPWKLSIADQELRRNLLWRAEFAARLAVSVSEEAADRVRAAARKAVVRLGSRAALARELDDLGILGLVARAEANYQGAFVVPFARANAWTYRHGNAFYLQGLFLAGLAVTAARAICFFLGATLAARAVIEAITRLRRALYLQTFRLGTLAFRSLGPSEAVGVSTRHLEAVHEGLILTLTSWRREPVKFALVLLFAVLVNVWLAVVFLILAWLTWLIAGQFAAHYRTRMREAERETGEQLALLQESLMLMRLVKVYLMEQFNQSRFEKQLADYARAQRTRYWSEVIYRGAFRLIAIVAGLGLLYLSGRIVLVGGLGVASGLTMAAAIISLYWPATAWLEDRRILRRSRESARVLFEFLDRAGSVGQAGDAEFLPAMSRALEFDNVSLREPGTGKRLLRGVSMTVRAGEKVALVGPDDMEKYAVVYLLSRFLDPSQGQIRIDRKNIREVTFDSLRAQIATVLQHNLVFNDTVANNIGCGDPAFTLARIIEAAKIAHAHQFIQKLPRGYDTPIGDLGHSLNMGEKFRVALARAILRDPALLIIEETTAPLDDDTKGIIDDTFSRILPGRTVIFLPHRLSTLKSCDKVFFLHEGRIVDQGDHRELLQGNDLYRHLQYLEFNEFAGMFVPPPATVPDVKI